MRKFITSTIAALSASAAMFANDAVFYTSGNQLVPFYESDIRVSREVLTVTLTDTGRAGVDVDYEFYNPGSKAKTVTMGFVAQTPSGPDVEYTFNAPHPNIYDFTVSVNGRDLPWQTQTCPADVQQDGDIRPIDLTKWHYSEEYCTYTTANEDEFLEVAIVYYFEARFEPGVNRVHHTYSYDESTGVGFSFQVDYALTPAARWAGKQIDDFTLIIRADHTAKHFLVGNEAFAGAPWKVTEGMGKMRPTTHYDRSYTEVSLRNGSIVWHRSNYRPTAELTIVSADAMSFYDRDSRFGAFYDRSNSRGLMQEDYETGEPWNEPKDHAKRVRVAHNLPYAHRGHVFRNAEMKRYFESLWWYIPDPEYVDDPSTFLPADHDYLNYK